MGRVAMEMLGKRPNMLIPCTSPSTLTCRAASEPSCHHNTRVWSQRVYLVVIARNECGPHALVAPLLKLLQQSEHTPHTHAT